MNYAIRAHFSDTHILSFRSKTVQLIKEKCVVSISRYFLRILLNRFKLMISRYWASEKQV
jgi:hypothetical protein